MCSSRSCFSSTARRRLRQQALGALGLGEGDHVADRLGTGHQRHDAVQAEGQAAVRRRAVLQRVEQEAELELRFLGRDLEGIEHLLLHVGAMDTDRAAPHLPAIEHHVVTLGDALVRVGHHPVLMPVLGRGERVVGGGVALGLVVELEHREVDHPHRTPAGRRTGRCCGRTRCGRSSAATRRWRR